MSAEWRDRIIGMDEVPPDTLRDNPRNWRIHGSRQRETMTEIMDEAGWLEPVLVNKRTMVVIDGHMRLDLARRRGEALVPVEYVELDDVEEARALVSLNPMSALAEENQAAKAELTSRVRADRAALRSLIGLGVPELDHEDDDYDGELEPRDAELTRDHTKTILDEEADDGLTLGGYEDDGGYTGEAIRLISFVMTTEEYDDCLDVLEDIGTREGLPTNSDVILWLLEQYAPAPAEAEDDD